MRVNLSRDIKTTRNSLSQHIKKARNPFATSNNRVILTCVYYDGAKDNCPDIIKTVRTVLEAFYTQKFSGQSARIHFSQLVKKARKPLARHKNYA